MSASKQQITGAELEIMEVLWKSPSPMALSEIQSALASREWKNSTAATLLGRMAEKKIIGFRQEGRARRYYPVLKKEDYGLSEARSLLSRLYDGSVGRMVAALYENSEISGEDIAALKKLFDLE